ncbi:MAG: biofilm PGA synthesis N-glycosyltransferase PgaC [Myxococcota bacterium]
MLTLAFILLALMAYIYLGYPLLVWMWASLAPRPIRRGSDQPPVSVLLPIHAGAQTVADKLSSLLAQDYPREQIEIRIYVDGADPETEALIRAVSADEDRIHLVVGAERKGKPAGLNRLVADAAGEILVLTDVRQPLEPGAIAALVATLGDPDVACVSGNRLVSTDVGAGMYWRYEQWIRRNEARARSMIGATGPLYALRRQDWLPIPQDIVLDDVYLPMSIRMKTRGRLVLADGARFTDVDMDDQRELERKVRALAGNYQLLARLPRLWIPLANPSWFATISHRILRLVAPWLLLALGVATTALLVEKPLRPEAVVLGVGHVVVYGAATLGRLAGPPGRLARSFVWMNAAAIWGLARYASGRLTVLW